jgi:hypothetical protein
MTLHFRSDECLELAFTLQEEVAANPRELVRPVFRHIESELPDLLAVKEDHLWRTHAASLLLSRRFQEFFRN